MKTKTTLWWTCGVVHMGQTSQTDGPFDSENGVRFIHTTVEHKSGVRLGQLYCVNWINTLSIRHLKWNPKSGIWSFFIVLRPKSVLGTTCSVQLWTTVNSSFCSFLLCTDSCFSEWDVFDKSKVSDLFWSSFFFFFNKILPPFQLPSKHGCKFLHSLNSWGLDHNSDPIVGCCETVRISEFD